MNDRLRTVLLAQAGHQPSVANVALHEMVAGICCHRCQVVGIPRVRQLVQVDNLEIVRLQQQANETGADKTSSSSYDNLHFFTLQWLFCGTLRAPTQACMASRTIPNSRSRSSYRL